MEYPLHGYPKIRVIRLFVPFVIYFYERLFQNQLPRIIPLS